MSTVRMSIMVCVLGIGLAGCVGSPLHSTLTYNSIQSTIKKNNENLMALQVGTSQPEVRATLSDPERSEGYEWGSAWLYRTAMTSGIYGTEDTDFTPVVFDSSGTLVGWGRNFFVEHVRRFELRIRPE